MKPRTTIHQLIAVLSLATSLQAMPQWSQAALSQSRAHLAACSSGSKALFAGGGGPLGDRRTRVDIYDAQTGSWSTADLSEARSGLAATAVGGKILFAGGATHSGQSDVVDIYDTTTELWSTATLTQPRGAIGAGSVAGLAFFAGGTSTSGKTDLIDIYSASTGTWSTTALSVPRFGIQVVTIGTRIFFVGGSTYPDGPIGPSDVIDIYDSSNGSWSTMQLPGAIPLTGSASVGDLVFCCAGGDEVWIYDDSNGSWTTTFLSQSRHGVSATAVGDRVLFAGGYIGVVDLATVDIYDTTTGAWQVAALSTARDTIASTALADRALFAGGYDEWPGVSAVVDIYTPGPGHGFCFGDGLGTPCPCSNGGLPGQGCVNSNGAGALLTSFASASVSAADLGFTLTGAVPAQHALLFAGQAAVGGGLGIPFGDGLRCAGGPVVRLDSRLVDGDGTAVWAPAPSGGWNPGNLRRFQAFYRDPAGPCGSTFNLSNGVEIQFVP